MSEISLEAQYELAEKIKTLVMFVGLLTDEEVEAIKSLRQQLKEQSGNLSAVAGILAPLEESEHKVKHNTAMIKRIDAILAIHESNIEIDENHKKLAKSKEAQANINRALGL